MLVYQMVSRWSLGRKIQAGSIFVGTIGLFVIIVGGGPDLPAFWRYSLGLLVTLSGVGGVVGLYVDLFGRRH